MRHLAHGFVVLATLVLLTFGAGGVSVMKCACSGKATLLMVGGDCCPAESGCMTVTTVHVSDSALTDHSDDLPSPPVAAVAAVWQPVACVATTLHRCESPAQGWPPPRFTLSPVLRL